jgi:cell shape-determining protein MreD
MQGRPFGATVISLLVMFQGVFAIVLGLTVFAGVMALIQFGIGSDNLPSLVPAVISAIVFAYMFSERVRPFYDPD